MAAGTSAASWNSAVLRAWRGLMPSASSRWVSRAPLIGLSGLPAGEQPGRGPGGADGGVALAVRRDGAGDRGDRLGQLDGDPAELEPDGAVAAGLDLAGGHAADRRDALGVEEDEQPGEAVFGLERVIVQEPAGGVPPVLAVEDGGGPGPPGGGGKVAGGEAGGVRPADELPGFFPVDGLAAGEPAVEVGLLAGAQGEAGGVEPVQERDGAAGQPAGQEGLLPGGGFPVVAAAHAPDQVPDQVAVQEPAPFRVGLGVQQAVEERLEPGHLLVAPAAARRWRRGSGAGRRGPGAGAARRVPGG